MNKVDYPVYISVAEAQQHIHRLCSAKTLSNESVPIEQALGRVLAEDIIAPFNVPTFANSAMDGFALRSTDLPAIGERAFRLIGTVLAGSHDRLRVGEGECVRITTGAPLPKGTDTVIIKERSRLEGDEVTISAGCITGANVRPIGEDYQTGDTALRCGDRLTASQLGVLASFGLVSINVARRPRVALFSTGDELVAPGQALHYGQIHDTNRYTLAALLSESNVELIQQAHLRDNPNNLRTALLETSTKADVIITTGGVSAGEADFLPRLAQELGYIHFWKVRIKPGMPILFAQIGQALWFGLPGNPVSSFATFLTLVQPGLAALQGSVARRPGVWYARLVHAIKKSHDRLEYQRARLESRNDGVLWVTPHKQQGSAMLRSIVEADCLVVLPEESRELPIASVVEVLPLLNMLRL